MNPSEKNLQKLPPIKRNVRSKNEKSKVEHSSEYLQQNNYSIPSQHNQTWFQAKKNAKLQEQKLQKNRNLKNFPINSEVPPTHPFSNKMTDQNPYQTKQPENNGAPNAPTPFYPPNANANAFQAPQAQLYTQDNNINRFQPQIQSKQFPRQQRIGCCCVSVHRRNTCCNIFCMPNLCHCVQRRNYACYCHNMDCVYCCAHVACRVCCYDKHCSGCIVQCCRHMPICLLLDCLKHGKCFDAACAPICTFLCGCIRGCNIRDCACVGQVCGAVCQLLCCFFK